MLGGGLGLPGASLTVDFGNNVTPGWALGYSISGGCVGAQAGKTIDPWNGFTEDWFAEWGIFTPGEAFTISIICVFDDPSLGSAKTPAKPRGTTPYYPNPTTPSPKPVVTTNTRGEKVTVHWQWSQLGYWWIDLPWGRSGRRFTQGEWEKRK